MNQSPYDKCCSTPAKTGDKLTKTEDVNAVDYKNLPELNTPCKHGDDSMHKLEQLAQVCCDRGGFESKNLVFVRTRRITRSMNSAPTAFVSMATRQSTQPVIVHLEDDVPSFVPETTHMNKRTLIKNNSAKLAKDIIESGKAEASPSCMDAYGSGPKPSFMSFPSPGQDIDNHDSSQADDSCHDKEEETLQQVLDKVYETKIIEFKNELKQCQANAALIEVENKTFREELLN